MHVVFHRCLTFLPIFFSMGFSKVSLALVCLMVLVLIIHTSYAQNSPKDYIIAHNAARAKVGVPPLTWNPKLAFDAENYANQRSGTCLTVHSRESSLYGENLAASNRYLSGVAAVELWVGEKSDYDYRSNTCTGVCTHYTQVVWRSSVEVGCANVRCNNGGSFIVCKYFPKGNIIGQRPY